MHLRRQGDLVVAENLPLKNQINRELKRIDSRLFLEKQIRPRDQRPAWYVMFAGSLDEEPAALFEWSGPDGVPLELSWSIVDRVIMGRLDRSPRAPIAQAEALAKNKAWQEKRSDWSLEEQFEVAREVVPMRHPIHSAVLPRGVYLRMHRDKKRAQGWRI